jgi:hypothetical protein
MERAKIRNERAVQVAIWKCLVMRVSLGHIHRLRDEYMNL